MKTRLGRKGRPQMNKDKPPYLLMRQDGSMSVAYDISESHVVAFDSGALEVIDMENHIYLKAITRGGYKWEFIDKEPDPR